jgi:hypothetical protein
MLARRRLRIRKRGAQEATAQGGLPDECPDALSWQEGFVGRALDVWAAVVGLPRTT